MTLSLDRVGLRYARGGPPILEGVSLDIPPGELVTVVGASGSGKTSLLRLAAGFARPTSGEVRVGGRPVTGPGADRAVVFQDDALFPWLRVRENVAFALRVKGVETAERRRQADEMLRLVGLQDFGDRHVWQLSGGQRQRVGIARALIGGPDYLLMDEPFGALDPMTRGQMQVALVELWARTGKGILFITHDIEEALLLATRLVVLDAHPGRVAQVIEPGFARRLAAGERARALRAEPAFVDLREGLLDDITGKLAA